MKVRLTKEQKIQILNSLDVFLVMQQILLRENKIGRSKEHFWVICLANNNSILNIELVSLGSVKDVIINPMEVFSFALQKRTVKIILVHNHPSGNLEPSEGDKDITDRMYQAGLFLQLPVLDHIILNEEYYYSFKDSHLLDKISRSEKYVMPFLKEERRLIKKGEEIGEKKGEKRGRETEKIEMAKGMKKRGIDIAVIAEISGLPAKQIEKL